MAGVNTPEIPEPGRDNEGIAIWGHSFPAAIRGPGPVPPAREWFMQRYPELFRDADWGWGAPLHEIPGRPYKGNNHHTGLEKAAVVTATVASLREEAVGTVRRSDGTVDVERSYSQWDVDNGYWPRCFRRDRGHFSKPGAEYLSLLVAAFIEEKGW